MKRYSIFLSILIFCFCFFCFCADTIAVTLKRNFTADTYPEGGHPVDKTHFNKFSFSLKDLNLDTSKYYDIDARLTSTNYKGYAANFGTTTSSDLKFHRDDNKGWNFEGADHLHYKWTTDPKQQSVPGTITVRCYDWGAAGSVTVTVKETDGVGNPIGMGVSDTQLIPYDDNENGIADGWETVASVKVLLENNLMGYDPDWDEEVAPDAKNKNNGDGWTNLDEWRGIFQTRNDTEVARLDVTQKDVMVCSDEAMASLGTGNTPKIKKHLIRKLEPYQEDGTWSLVNDPWGNVFKNYKIDFDNTNEDLGWVNFNSSQYSEKRVWAIRIRNAGGDDKKANSTGYTSGGSPSQYTQAMILIDNIQTKVNKLYTEAVEDNKKNRKAQHDKKAEEYEKKATEEEANGNVAEGQRLRRKAANERAKGDNFEWKAGTPKRIDSAIELMTKDTIAHEVLHDHNVNAHCGHLGCFMNAVTEYIVKFEGGFKAQAGGRDVNKLILDSRHNNTLAVTGHTRAKVAFYGENIEVTVEAPPPLEDDPSSMSLLFPSDDVYTASAGDSHTANFTSPSPYTSIDWYVKSPGDTSDRGSLVETDTGDGSLTTASLDYTFAVDAVGGAYIITAYVTTSDGVYEVSYTVTIPTIPESPSITGAFLSKTYLTLLWNKPSDDGGATIEDYEYRYRVADTLSDWIDWRSAGSNTNEKVVDLTPGTGYIFEVRAKNSVGYSDASEPKTYTTSGTAPSLPTVPGAPVSLSAVAGDGSVELSWQPPVSDGNSSILRYEYRYGIGESVTSDNYTAWKSMGSAMATFPVSPLTNDMYHIFEVRAVNAIGDSLPSDPATATPTAPTLPDPITPPPEQPTPPPPTSVPGQPTGLTFTVSNGVVKLSWTAPENDGGVIDTYQYRVDENNDGSWGDWESLDSANTSATLNLSNGRTYGIQVRAKNSLGSSTHSTKVTAMPVDASVPTPSAPRNLTATGENGQVRLSWTAPATGTGIIAYEYRYDTNDDGSWRSWKLTDSTATSHIVTGLTNETLYAFKVRARNAGGIGTQSDKVTATPTAITVPTKPRNLTASLLSDGRVYLNWDVPLDDGGSVITDYDYIIDTDNDGSWGAWGPTGDTGTDEYFSHMSPGVTYAFKVRAENKRGVGSASDKAVITIPAITPPTAPQNFSATAGFGSVSLNWHAPTDDGGDSRITYQYRYGGSTTGAWSSAQSSTAANISGLTPGSTYQFELRAKNSAGKSPTVITTATPKAPTAPGQPTALSVVSTSNGTVNISWTAPENDGGGIDGYEYHVDPNNDGTWNDWESLDSSATSATLNLQNGRTYGIQVRAKNSVGNSVQSTKVTALPVDPSVTVPSAPRNLTATAENGQVVLSWDTPATSNGIIEYEYRYDTGDDGSWLSWKITNSTSTSYTVTGLTNETVYAFKVRARNAGGIGTASAKVTATPTAITVPGAPRNLTVSGIDRTTVYLGWDAPIDDGGSTITSYRYHIDIHNDGSWEELRTLNSTSTSTYLYYFTPGETYAFMISAVNEMGPGTTSNIAVITMQPITPPSAPQDLSADAGNASVYLSWSYPADDGGDVPDYQYRYRQTGGTWSAWSTLQWESYVTVTSLTNGTTYDFEVVGTNDAGMGAAATRSATPTGTAVPGVPTYFYTSSDNGAVYLYWDPPEFDGGSPITDYEYNYLKTGGSWKGWASAGNANVDYPEYRVTGLTNGTTYQFKVRAKNAVGPGESTSVLSETPHAKKPDAPTALSAAAGTTTGSIDLTWTAPNDNGSPMTDYEVKYCKYENGWKNWTKYASTGSTNTSYTVTGLESGELYRFRVRAVNSVGEGDSSKVAQTTAP